MHRRRWPGRTRAGLELLAQLERHDPMAAREFERELDRQHRAEVRFRTHETTGTDPADIADQRTARAGETGGGRKRPTRPTNDD